MSENVNLMSIPGIMSTNPNAVINAIVNASLKGFKVYLTSEAYDMFKDYFNKLGIQVRETSNIDDDAYILITVTQEHVKVEIMEGGRTHIRNFKIDIFISALERYIEKRRGASEETKLYELMVSEDLREKLLKIKGDSD